MPGRGAQTWTLFPVPAEERKLYPGVQAALISEKIYAFAYREDGSLQARMFTAPGSAMVEDPATGAAATCLAGTRVCVHAASDGLAVSSLQ